MAARGDKDRSAVLATKLSNHILLCKSCHSMVDANPAAFPEQLLLKWKQNHEERVQSLLRTGLVAEQTFALHLRARFGGGEGRMLVAQPPDMLQATLQVGRFFKDPDGHLTIDADLFRRDTDQGYWNSAYEEMRGILDGWIRNRGGIAALPHLSVFPSGPIPLLIVLGRLLGDTRPIDVHDFDRNHSSWLWPDLEARDCIFRVKASGDAQGDEIRLVVELSGRTDRDVQTQAVCGNHMPEILLDVAEPAPGLIRGPEMLPPLRQAFQQAFELAKSCVGDRGTVHVFAAMPAAAAVAMGQAQFPKAMPVVHVYDNNVQSGGWRCAVSFEHGGELRRSIGP